MALIPEEIIAQVIDRCDIVEIISSYIPLKKAGRSFKANCPFHNEKTPSFVVNPQKQIFHCFGCGVGGNALSFVIKFEKLDFPEAIRQLAQRVNVDIPEQGNRDGAGTQQRQEIFEINKLAAEFFHSNLISGKSNDCKQARDYLKKRDISLQTVKDLYLGFACDDWEALWQHLKKKDLTVSLIEKSGLVVARDNKEGFYDRFRNRIIFPIFDLKDQCRGFGGRLIASGDSASEKGAKYINSPETPVYTKGQYLYGLPLARTMIEQKDFALIVEGYMDFAIPYQAGVHNIVASLGTALTVEQVRLLHRYTENIVMLYDSDEAGAAAMLRSFEMLIEEEMNVQIAVLPEGEDPDSFIRQHGIDAFEQQISQAQSLVEFKLSSLKAKYDLKRIEDKAKVADEMLLLIRKFESDVLVSEHTRWLAGQLGVAEHVLVSQSQNLNSKIRTPLTRNEKAAVNLSGPGPDPFKPVEISFLKMLLEEEGLIEESKKRIDIEDFTDERIRLAITKIFATHDQGKKVSTTGLMNSIIDSELQTVLSKMMVLDQQGETDKKKVMSDYVAKIKNNRLKVKTDRLRDQIREAEVSGDDGKLKELMKEFNQLIRK